MSGEGYRILLDCRRRARALRARSFTFDQIADVLSLDHAVSPLRLYRYAHGRTASDVVTVFNDLDPAGAASLREARLYDYEAWPDGGRRPSARTIATFARIYQTAACRLLPEEAYASYDVRDRDLLDRADHRHLDPCQSSHRHGHVRQASARDTMRAETGSGGIAARGPAHYAELLRALSAEEADVRRRELLFELALVLGGTPALGLLRHLTPLERERLVATAGQRAPVDSDAIGLLEKLMNRLWGMDERLGPAQVLPVAEAKRALVGDLLKQASLTPDLRDRLLRLYWNLSLMTGWSHFDLTDYAGASRRYNEGLAAAHELGAPALIAHLHGLLAYMALHQRRPSVALDHAFAAEGWAKESGHPLQQAAASIQLARALSRVKRDEGALRLIDRAAHLAGRGRSGPVFQHLGWLTPDCVPSYGIFCLLELNRPDQVLAEVRQRLATMDSNFVRERGLLQAECATALVQKREIVAAAEMIGEAAQVTATHSSARLVQSVRQARARLDPWADNRHVRDLDERLRTLSVTG
ncbi:hypothetical protein [Streptosporangium carneum]|uniref:XRE family transcriptional regulator n=1 Tax=Streptosporangium carneum TaxID=47481 RepID=A0A9W6I3J6_9ACTN|nr:hypothetical protein [Streptosporangium carneum]GLK10776.1 hypothetical protein GCM10017600_41820 [Streptosporangium carneum]